MNTWLNADQVAARLGISRRSALYLMSRMPHAVISGAERKRIRVSEAQLDAWLMKRSTGKPVSNICTGSRKKLARREA